MHGKGFFRDPPPFFMFMLIVSLLNGIWVGPLFQLSSKRVSYIGKTNTSLLSTIVDDLTLKLSLWAVGEQDCGQLVGCVVFLWTHSVSICWMVYLHTANVHWIQDITINHPLITDLTFRFLRYSLGHYTLGYIHSRLYVVQMLTSDRWVSFGPGRKKEMRGQVFLCPPYSTLLAHFGFW